MPRHGIVSTRSVNKEAFITSAKAFADYSFEQAPEYVTASAARAGDSVLLLTVGPSERPLGVATVRLKTLPLIGRGIAYISSGPMTQSRSAADEDHLGTVLSALKRKLVDEDGHLLLIRLPATPLLHAPEIRSLLCDIGFLPSTRARTYRTIALDLRRDVHMIRSNLHQKWRNQLNSVEKAGLCIEVGVGEDATNRFLKVYDEMRQTKDFAMHLSPRFFLALSPESTGLKVLIATKHGQDVGGHVVSLLGDTAIALFSATNEFGRAAKAGYLMHWTTMLIAKEMGLKWYDLGGIDPTANPEGYLFKKRTGGLELLAAPYEAAATGPLSFMLRGLLTLRARLIAK